jgi:hypothetical protein
VLYDARRLERLPNRITVHTMNAFDSFTLSPMSAGDIIDRAVRLYKRHFFVLLRIVLAPSLMAYTGAILLSIGWRNFSIMRGDSRVALTSAMMIVGGVLWVVGEASFYAALGGSSRALVAHLVEGKPIRARDVYASVRERIWSLIGATLMVALLIIAVSWGVLTVVGIILMIAGAIAAQVISTAPGWVQTVFGILYLVVAGGLMLLTFLVVYSRLVYVPQILMVERKSVFNALSRSFQLASGELIRIAAVVIFWVYVAWSVWVLMAAPVEWYAYTVGVDISPFNAEAPIWYQVAKQTLTQVSEILIWPIAMLCFTLLYVNSRVRKEGYDVEVMANRVLTAPQLPVQPDLASVGFAVEPAPVSPVPSILGLSDYRPIVQPPPEPVPATPASGALFDPPGEVASLPPPDLQARETAAAPGPEPDAANGVRGKSCPWCGSEALVQDRFCRICGSVF